MMAASIDAVMAGCIYICVSLEPAWFGPEAKRLLSGDGLDAGAWAGWAHPPFRLRLLPTPSVRAGRTGRQPAGVFHAIGGEGYRFHGRQIAEPGSPQSDQRPRAWPDLQTVGESYGPPSSRRTECASPRAGSRALAELSRPNTREGAVDQSGRSAAKGAILILPNPDLVNPDRLRGKALESACGKRALRARNSAPSAGGPPTGLPQ